MTQVTVTTGARLHFGPLSVAAPAGGRFGGAGVMIDSPKTVITVSRADRDSVESDDQTSSRILEFVSRIRQSMPRPVPAVRIVVSETIPAHRGFGSGTQLGLAIAKALSLIAQEATPDVPTLARRVGRGLRSAIGLFGFERGGFLVDGGRVSSDQLGTLVSRLEFPADWRFVLAAPRQTVGLSGTAEQAAFAKQPPMPAALTAELCRIVLMDWLPAVIEADFQRCAESMYQFGHLVGEFFSAAQGGIFANQRITEWAKLVRARGLHGIAQTSWGPTVAVLCTSQSVAEQLYDDFDSDPAWNDCIFDVASPLNCGAAVTVDQSLTS
jgi:beta-RFAP synthase